MLRVFSDAGLPVAEQAGGRRGHHHDPAAARRHRQAARRLPGHGGAPRAVRERRQPAAGVRAAVGRGDRGGPAAGHGRPVGPRQHQGRRDSPGSSTRSTRTPGRSAASPASPTSRSLPEAPDLARDRGSAAGGRRHARRRAARAGCAAWWCSPPAIDAPAGADLLAVCRRHGMRLIGPNCFGIAVPSIGLDATFAAANPAPGERRPRHAVRRPRLRDGGPPHPARHRHLLVRLGRQQARRLEQRHADVVGAGRATKVAVLYIESFGNPRKFGRTARRVGAEDAGADRARGTQRGRPARRRVAYRGDRHPAGHQGGAVRAGGDHRHAELRRADGRDGAARHPAAARGPDGGDRVQRRRRRRARRRRLHRPRARRAPPARADQARLHAIVAGRRRGQRAGGHHRHRVRRRSSAQVLETLGADEDVHAVIALVLPTGATGDLHAAIAEADIGVPLAVVVLNQPEAVRLVDAKRGKAPSYAYPETAARALSRAVKYAEWRAAPRRTVPAFPDVDTEAAREIVHAFLARQPGGRLAAASTTSSPCSRATAYLGCPPGSRAPRTTRSPRPHRPAIRWRSRPWCPA